MERQQFLNLFRTVEVFAESNPRGLERRVFWLIVLGNSFFAAVFFSVWIVPFLFVVGALNDPAATWKLLRSGIPIYYLVGLLVYIALLRDVFELFLTRQPPPHGIKVSRNDCEPLIKLIEKLCDDLKSPLPNGVFIVPEFNAAVNSLPKLGIFGQRNYLTIGYPILLTLSTSQLEAVIAHELGHISRRHGRLRSRAYQVREMWSRMADRQNAEGKKPGALFTAFMNWYFPRLNAYTLVLCRQQEKTADESALKIAGSKAFGEALILIAIRSRATDEQFNEVFLKEVADREVPPGDSFQRLAHILKTTDDEVERRHLSEELAEAIDPVGTHPDLATRLRTIGYWIDDDLPPLPTKIEGPGATELLGEFAGQVERRLSREWGESVSDWWREQHNAFAKLRHRISELNERDELALTEAELVERAAAIGELEGSRAALNAWQDILKLHPRNASALFNVGSILLTRGDEDGISYLKEAAKLDPRFKVQGLFHIYEFQITRGRAVDAEKSLAAIEAEEEVAAEANRERSEVLATDKFETHRLPAEELETLIAVLGEFQEIETAYVVRKVVKHYDRELPMNLLFVEVRKRSIFTRGKRRKPNEVISALWDRLGHLDLSYIVSLERGFRKLRPVLENVGNSSVYRNHKSE